MMTITGPADLPDGVYENMTITVTNADGTTTTHRGCHVTKVTDPDHGPQFEIVLPGHGPTNTSGTPRKGGSVRS